MNEALKVFAEIFFSFLAVAGAVFMINEFYELIKYRTKKALLPLIIDTRRFSPDEIYEILRVCQRLTKKREASRLLGGIVFVTGEGSRISDISLNEIKESYNALVLSSDDSLGKLKDIIK